MFCKTQQTSKKNTEIMHIKKAHAFPGKKNMKISNQAEPKKCVLYHFSLFNLIAFYTEKKP